MKKTVVINGKGGSGKDTFIGICEMLTQDQVYSFTSISIVNRAAKLLGWEGNTKTQKDRKFLSDLKALSIWYNDQPNDYMIYSLKQTEDNSINFFHIREKEEIIKFINTIKKENIQTDIHTLLLTRFNNDLGNRSDDGVNDIDYSFTIDNNCSIFELELKAMDFLTKIGVKTHYEN